MQDEIIVSTLRLDKNLKQRAKEQAKKESRTLTGLITYLLKKHLEEQEKAA